MRSGHAEQKGSDAGAVASPITMFVCKQSAAVHSRYEMRMLLKQQQDAAAWSWLYQRSAREHGHVS